MTTRRMAKAAEAIRETVSTTVLFELRDPRVKNVTIISAEAASDMRTAKVYVSVMGTPKEQSLCMYGLESAKGFIQAKLADRLQTRYTPVLTFVLDPGVKKSIEASRRLREVLPPEATADDDDLEAEETDADDVEDDAAAGSPDDPAADPTL
jgi:ribosome-binding factor A